MSTSNSDNCNNFTWGVAGGSAALGFFAGLLVAKMPADGFSKNNMNWFKNNDINNDNNNIMNNNDNTNIENNNNDILAGKHKHIKGDAKIET